MKAVDFNLPDQNGNFHTLSDYKGKWLVLYFYPKDDTPGCTKEACNFRDGIEEFKKRGVEVIGISKDDVNSHQRFIKKYSLNFTLLADPTHETIKGYGAWGKKSFEGILRNTYLINPEGEIVKEYTGVNPSTHADQLLTDLEELR